LFGVAAAPGDWWWLILGAVAMLAMLLGASIPMMEERSLQRRSVLSGRHGRGVAVRAASAAKSPGVKGNWVA
jgi:hypothetical protein